MAGQAAILQLQRSDSTPWGFRLQGGKEFGSPLTVAKVNGNSLAERAGLKPGDTIIQISGRDTENMRHKEAQDSIARSGNSIELRIVRGGVNVWKPRVDAVGYLPKSPMANGTLLTKTSLVKEQRQVSQVGGKHNVSAKPFDSATVTAVMHKQFNSPAALYSMQNIAETLSAHTEVLATGVIGINFMKEDPAINTQSAVYRLVHEEESGGSGKSSPAPSTPTPSTPGVRLGQPQPTFRKIESPAAPPPPQVAPKPLPMRPQSDAASAGQTICAECGAFITGVFARIGERSLHPECFKCNTCGVSLKNVGHYNINDKLYCEFHAKTASKVASAEATKETFKAPSTFTPIPAAKLPQHSPATALPSIHSVSPIPFRPTKPVAPMSFSKSAYSKFSQITRAHSPVTGGSKFTWPPQKPEMPASKPVFESNATQSFPTYTPSAGTQHVSPSQSSFSTKSFSSSYESNAVSMFQTSSQTQSTSIASFSSVAPPPFSEPEPLPEMAPAPVPMSSLSQAPASVPEPEPIPALASEPPAPIPDPTPISTQPVDPIPESAPLPSQDLTAKPVQSTPSSGQRSQAPGIGSRPAPRRGRGQLVAAGGSRIPICAACASPIRGPFIMALSKSWCPDHFLCTNSVCRRPLQDIGFVEDQGQLYCEHCYEQYLAPVCAKCNKRIKEECLIALEKHWHTDCFICAYCNKPFGNDSFFLEDGLPYCEKDWNELFTTKCVGCGFPIEAGDRWVEALNNNYHSQCFKCTICNKNLEGQSFYAKAGRPICKAHAR